MRDFRSLPVFVLLCLYTLFATVAASAEGTCDSVDTSQIIYWMTVKKGVGKLHFLAGPSPDHPNCPRGNGCELSTYLVGGEQIIIVPNISESVDVKNHKAMYCIFYRSPEGEAIFGWLDSDGLDRDRGFGYTGNGMELMGRPEVLGSWTSDTANADIMLRADVEENTLHVEGSATFSVGASINTGDISGPVFIHGDTAGYSDYHYDGSSPDGDALPANSKNFSHDDDGCRVRFRFTGYYLLVDDNYQCGGQGVSFSGVYIKQSARKQ